MFSTMPETKVLPSSEIDLGTLLKLIPDFNTSDNSKVYNFIRSCDSAFQYASNSQKSILLTYALNKLTGPGSSDVHSKQFFKWDDLKQFLIQKFSQTKTLAHLTLELQSLFQKPQESITNFFLRVDLCRSKIIEKLTAEITDSTIEGRLATTEETALNVFVNGVRSDIGMMLRVREFKTISDAGNFAIQEEKIRNMNTAREMLYRNSMPSSFSRKPASALPVHQPSKFPPPNPVYTHQQCNYCKKPGHSIQDCRKRAYNNSLKQSNSRQQLPSPAAKTVNHLNSAATEVMDMPSEIASTNFFNVQTPISNLPHMTQQIDTLQLE